MKKLLFLDFDGVLFDTAVEAFHVGFKVYFGLAYDPVLHSEIFHLFKKNRFLVGPAWHYFYLFKAIEQYLSRGINVRNGFLELKLQASKDKYSQFETSFFAYRKTLREKDFGNWIKLNAKYPFFEYFKEFLACNRSVITYILSTKDEETINRILVFNDVDFPIELILGKNTFELHSTKAAIIKMIMNEHQGCSAIFIDDSWEHLQGCKGIRDLETIQNNWGYIDPLVGNAQSLNQIIEILGNI